MRIQPHSSAATAVPAAAAKSGRQAHTPAMKASTSVPAAAAKPAVARSVAAAAPKVATPAKAAEAAARPETYGGAGSLLDAHA